jgi:hypothetical protein
MHAHPARATCGAKRLAVVEVALVGALETAQVVAATEHVGRGREQLQIVRPKGSRAIRE